MYSTYMRSHDRGRGCKNGGHASEQNAWFKGQCFGLAEQCQFYTHTSSKMRIHSAPTRLLPYIPIQNTLREGAKIWPELSSLRSRSHGWTTARRLVIDSGNKTSGNSRLKTKGAWHEVHQEFWDLTWILCFALADEPCKNQKQWTIQRRCINLNALQSIETTKNSVVFQFTAAGAGAALIHSLSHCDRRSCMWNQHTARCIKDCTRHPAQQCRLWRTIVHEWYKPATAIWIRLSTCIYGLQASRYVSRIKQTRTHLVNFATGPCIAQPWIQAPQPPLEREKGGQPAMYAS